MTFVSFEFFVFLCVTFSAYYLLGRSSSSQIFVLIIASAVFYAWENPKLLVLLAVVATVAAVSSLLVVRESRGLRTAVLTLSIVFLVGTLALFKYGGLFYTSLAGIGRMPEWERWFLNIPLPIGISFYIFHAISLIVDVDRGQYRLPPGSSFAGHMPRTFLYITFFPQLIAGPIMKAKDFFPQIERKHAADIDWRTAFQLLTLGYFLKMVIADNLAAQTQAMSYPYFQNYPSSRLVSLLIAYSCQIFSDFFGYSLIAMGLATLFGYRLPVNFNRPYIADSFSDFWRRWHMSLSAWLRDYLYVPLGGSRHGRLRTYVNLFVVMFLGGLWHGAAWSYAIWGTLHGLALAIERPFSHTWLIQTQFSPVKILRIVFVFTVVSIGWLFFKFSDQSQAFAYLASIVRNVNDAWYPADLLTTYAYCLPILIYHLFPILGVPRVPAAARKWSYPVMLFMIATNSGIPGAFIYFQF